MSQLQTRTLNRKFLLHRINLLGLKHYWLADQVGVHRITLSRWLSGNIRQVRENHLTLLAEQLECQTDELVLGDHEQVANRDDYRRALREVLWPDTRSLLLLSGKASQYESLLRISMGQDLSCTQKVQCFCALSESLWKQGRFQESKTYAERAVDFSSRLHEASEQQRAKFQLANCLHSLGHLLEASWLFEDLLSQVQNKYGRISIQINYASLLRERGELNQAATLAKSAQAELATTKRNAFVRTTELLALACEALISFEGRFDDLEQSIASFLSRANAAGNDYLQAQAKLLWDAYKLDSAQQNERAEQLWHQIEALASFNSGECLPFYVIALRQYVVHGFYQHAKRLMSLANASPGYAAVRAQMHSYWESASVRSSPKDEAPL